MANRVLLEEIHLTITVPQSMPDSRRERARQTLSGRRFRSELKQAVLACVRAFPTLRQIRLTVAV